MMNTYHGEISEPLFAEAKERGMTVKELAEEKKAGLAALFGETADIVEEKGFLNVYIKDAYLGKWLGRVRCEKGTDVCMPLVSYVRQRLEYVCGEERRNEGKEDKELRRAIIRYIFLCNMGREMPGDREELAEIFYMKDKKTTASDIDAEAYSKLAEII